MTGVDRLKISNTNPGIVHWLSLSLLLLTLTGCSSISRATGIKHLVLCWLKQPDHVEDINRVIETSKELSAIPGIIDIAAGTAIASDREIVDDTFDVGLVMTFENVDTMKSYLSHEDHIRRVNLVFRPLCQRILVYDIAY